LNKKFNPYDVLGIKKGDNAQHGFYNAITNNNIKKRIMATLAFDSLSTKDSQRYKSHPNDCFSL